MKAELNSHEYAASPRPVIHIEASEVEASFGGIGRATPTGEGASWQHARARALPSAGARMVQGAGIFAVALLLLMPGSWLRADSPVPAKAKAKSPANSAATNLLTAPPGTNSVLNTNLPINMDTLDDKHTLAIGDHLSYRVVEDDEPPMQLVVADSGDLEIPLAKGEKGTVILLGRYPVVGLTCKKLAWLLKADLDKNYYWHATVILAVDALSARRGRIYITGAVHSPGPQEIPSDEPFTLSKAILRAGGLTDYAKGKSVHIFRKDPKTGKDLAPISVDVDKILKGNRGGDMVLEPDDLVLINESGIRL